MVLAYQQNSDVRVRRSTNEGASFGSAKTIRNNSDEGFVSARPTTVAVKGERMVVGVVEYFGDVGLSGWGFGYLSTNGGSQLDPAAVPRPRPARRRAGQGRHRLPVR